MYVLKGTGIRQQTCKNISFYILCQAPLQSWNFENKVEKTIEILQMKGEKFVKKCIELLNEKTIFMTQTVHRSHRY